MIRELFQISIKGCAYIVDAVINIHGEVNVEAIAMLDPELNEFQHTAWALLSADDRRAIEWQVQQQHERREKLRQLPETY